MCMHVCAEVAPRFARVCQPVAEVVMFIRVVRATNDNMAPYYTEIAANTWISPSKDTMLL